MDRLNYLMQVRVDSLGVTVAIVVGQGVDRYSQLAQDIHGLLISGGDLFGVVELILQAGDFGIDAMEAFSNVGVIFTDSAALDLVKPALFAGFIFGKFRLPLRTIIYAFW